MKRIDWIYLFSLAAYGYLLWEQEPGLNFPLMNVILLTGIVLNDTSVLKNKSWLICAAAAMITSLSVLWHANVLCVFGNFVALLGVAGFSQHRENSLLASGIMAVINGAGAIGFMIVSFVNRISSVKEDGSQRSAFKRIVLVIIIILIALVFFMLYRGSSILFESFTNKIDLSFISVGWCIFMTIGAIALYGFYRQQRFHRLEEWDRSQPSQLFPGERQSFFDRMMTIDSEYFSGIALLSILNLMLLFVNGLDIAFLSSGAGFLPGNITYSQYVHQGISMLILSIICASALILLYFRNYHDANKSYRTMRLLALLWVFQNMFMVVATICRNHGYIFVYGLSYKRIGVDVFLLLALSGLLIISWKTVKQKSLAFVVHRFSWVVFTMLILAAPVRWDKLIFDYNSSLTHRLDMAYLNELTSDILVDQHAHHQPGYVLTHDEKYEIDRKTFRFLSRYRWDNDHGNWPSLTISHYTTYHALVESTQLQGDTFLYAGDSWIHTIYYFPCYDRITSLCLSGNQLENIGEAGKYPHLKILDLSGNSTLTSLEGIQQCKQLQELNVRETGITNYEELTKMPQLRLLHCSYIDSTTEQQLHDANPELKIDY